MTSCLPRICASLCLHLFLPFIFVPCSVCVFSPVQSYQSLRESSNYCRIRITVCEITYEPASGNHSTGDFSISIRVPIDRVVVNYHRLYRLCIPALFLGITRTACRNIVQLNNPAKIRWQTAPQPSSTYNTPWNPISSWWGSWNSLSHRNRLRAAKLH